MTANNITGTFFVFLALLTSFQPLQARLGETEIQCEDRYGPAKTDAVSKASEKVSPLIEGGITHTYDYQGWRLRIAFLQFGGPAVRIEYHKIPQAGVKPTITDEEVIAILNGNTPSGMAWAKASYDNPNSPNTGLAKMFEGVIAQGAGSKTWKRTDGAIAQMQTGGIMILLELPAARAYEKQLKQKKEQKARDSIPQF